MFMNTYRIFKGQWRRWNNCQLSHENQPRSRTTRPFGADKSRIPERKSGENEMNDYTQTIRPGHDALLTLKTEYYVGARARQLFRRPPLFVLDERTRFVFVYKGHWNFTSNAPPSVDAALSRPRSGCPQREIEVCEKAEWVRGEKNKNNNNDDVMSYTYRAITNQWLIMFAVLFMGGGEGGEEIKTW